MFTRVPTLLPPSISTVRLHTEPNTESTFVSLLQSYKSEMREKRKTKKQHKECTVSVKFKAFFTSSQVVTDFWLLVESVWNSWSFVGGAMLKKVTGQQGGSKSRKFRKCQLRPLEFVPEAEKTSLVIFLSRLDNIYHWIISLEVLHYEPYEGHILWQILHIKYRILQPVYDLIGNLGV